MIQFTGIFLQVSTHDWDDHVLDCYNGQVVNTGDWDRNLCQCGSGYHLVQTCVEWEFPGHCWMTEDKCWLCPTANCADVNYLNQEVVRQVQQDTVRISTKTSNVDDAKENRSIILNGSITVKDEVDRALQSLDINKNLASHAPGLFACVVIVLVVTILNSVAILVLFWWVRSMKSVVTKPDTGAV